ncbi:glycosyltransferase [Curtobacterium sp. MCPF17_052]|uniref:glycosyltransferase n=1 Tax=Curtobacterium sp. MCPF17_052 TaxID=2175655 RepID=UPI0024DFA5CF|nr:glycosyltransferase [Curtobacterium sp. MCPF17_052]WIB12458.1 glycosyltransferase [Curtobacterium sp. MCPF17_052]
MSADATTETTDTTAATGGRRPLRVLIAADTFAPDVNGAATFTEELALGLAARGHEVHVIAPSWNRWHAGSFDEEYRGVTLTVHRLASYRWPAHEWYRFAWPWTVRKHTAPIIAALQPDVVHIQSHIVVGRGVAREAHDRGDPDHRHQPLHAGEPARVHAVRQAHDAARAEDRLGGRGEDLPVGRSDHHTDRARRRLPA